MTEIVMLQNFKTGEITPTEMETSREFTIRHIKECTEEELNYIFVEFPNSEGWQNTKEDKLEAIKQALFFYWTWDEERDDNPYGIETDDLTLWNCYNELNKTSSKSRIDRYLQISSDNNWQHKHKAWKKLVHEKDKYTCVHCGSNKNLHAHHVKYRSEFPELEFDVDNGMTLCKSCHKKEHNKCLTNQ